MDLIISKFGCVHHDVQNRVQSSQISNPIDNYGRAKMAYELKPNEKFTPTMVYMSEGMVWGKLLSPQSIRVSTWLKTTIVPTYYSFYDAQVLTFSGNKPIPYKFSEYHVHLSKVQALHVLPPEKPEMDYDPNEPNRKMAFAVVTMGRYWFEGKRRISALADLAGSINTGKEVFSPMYEVTVKHPTIPSLKSIQVPYLLFRREHASYGVIAE
jgi:hypothetical protein